jgi:hypothetical protein
VVDPTPGHAGIVVHTYRGASGQHEWQINSGARYWFDSADPDKIRKRINDSRQQVEDTHRLIWPGIKIPEKLQPRPGTSSSRQSAQQQLRWFEHHTFPTSMFWAFMFTMFMNAKRPVALRQRSATLIKQVVSCVCKLGLKVKLLLLGGDGDDWREHEVDKEGKLHDTGALWTSGFKVTVQPLWNANVLNSSKTVSSTMDAPLLVDYLLFALDTVTRKNSTICKCMLQFKASALSVISQLALFCESHIEELTHVIVSRVHRDGEDKTQLSRISLRKNPAIMQMLFNAWTMLRNHEDL